ncbi:general secretion pathway protein G [Escherichia coli]|nr:general secretion pathway protein G [Escherichia coli]SQO42605.1 general secretion pathway protein G [Escherichia coli]
MRATDKQRGFTLLEIMVVIVIIGVLASLVVPNLMGNKEKADKQKAVSDIVALENALDMYKLDNHHYPTTNQGLESLVEAPTLPPLAANYNRKVISSVCLPIPGAMIMSSLILVNMVHTICFQQGPMVKWEPRTTSPTGV